MATSRLTGEDMWGMGFNETAMEIVREMRAEMDILEGKLEKLKSARSGGDLTAAEIVVACRNVGIDLNCGGCASAFYTGHAEEHDEDCASQLTVAANEATLHMAVARLGGMVEGRPTHRINFLQRIDELREVERKHDTYRSALAAVLHALGLSDSAPPEVLCREVVQREVLPEIARLKRDADAADGLSKTVQEQCEWIARLRPLEMLAAELIGRLGLDRDDIDRRGVPVGNEILAAVDKIMAHGGDHAQSRARIRRLLLDRVADIETNGLMLANGSPSFAGPSSLAARMQALALREFAATLGES